MHRANRSTATPARRPGSSPRQGILALWHNSLIESFNGLPPGSLLEQYQANTELVQAGGDAIIAYLYDAPPESTAQVSLMAHLQPRNNDNQPAWFHPHHNAWLARMNGSTPGDILQLYQADPTIQRLVGRIIDNVESQTLPPLISPPRRVSQPAPPLRRVPRVQTIRSEQSGSAQRGETCPHHSTASGHSLRHQPRGVVPRPGLNRTLTTAYAQRTRPHPAPEDEGYRSRSSRGRITPTHVPLDDDATATEDSELEESLSDIELGIAFDELDSFSDDWEILDAELAEPLQDGNLTNDSISNSSEEIAIEVDSSQPAVTTEPRASLSRRQSAHVPLSPGQPASVQRGSFGPEWFSSRPNTSPAEHTAADWSHRAREYQRRHLARMEAEIQRQKSTVHAARRQSLPALVFGAEVGIPGYEQDTEVETDFEGFEEIAKSVEKSTALAKANKSEALAKAKKSKAPTAGKSKSSTASRRAPIAQPVRRPSTPGGPAKRTRSKVKAAQVAKK